MPDSLISDVLHFSPVSGTYVNARAGKGYVNATEYSETIRFDVDGTYPQGMASGSYVRGLYLGRPTYWIASPLKQVGYSTWEGPILQVWGDVSLIPHKTVNIHVPRGQAFGVHTGPRMTVTFSGGPSPVTRELVFASAYFHDVTFEFDTVQDSPSVTSIDTCAHSNRPSYLPCERLTFDKVYNRAGVDVTQSSRRSTVPLSMTGGDSRWSDGELDAAMRKYWSSYSESPDWAVWTLFAASHETPTLLGEMFDYSGQNQRQGCAIFNQALDDSIPSNYPQRSEHVARMRFFDVIHEVGHCFNLHHAWLTYDFALNWPFFDNLDEYATFMNYPQLVNDFFGKFEYRFHDSELKFLRHAPDNFVEMGDAQFYGGQKFFETDDGTTLPTWKLELTPHRAGRVFQFLEPVTVTVTLTNTSGHLQVIDEAILEDGGNFSLMMGRKEGRAKLWRPFSQRCFLPTPRVLQPMESLSASFFIGSGLDGWYFAEPGAYTLQAILKTTDSVVATCPVHLRIAHPLSWDEEILAQDFFTCDVGRAIAFGAMPSEDTAVKTLLAIVDRFPDRSVAYHAAVALARGMIRDQKVLFTAPNGERGLSLISADHDQARKLFQRALFDKPAAAAEALGGGTYRKLANSVAAYSNSRSASKATGQSRPRKGRT